MPRNKEVRTTLSFLKDGSTDPPFFDEFLKLLKTPGPTQPVTVPVDDPKPRPSTSDVPDAPAGEQPGPSTVPDMSEDELFTTTTDLHQSYMGFLMTKTQEEHLLDIGVKFNRFARRMAKESQLPQSKIAPATDSRGNRGYQVCFLGQRRKVAQDKINYSECIERHLSMSEEDRVSDLQGKVCRKYISKVKNFGAFAVKDIGIHTLLCEYQGCEITMSEGQRREANEYKGMAPTMLFMDKACFDGYRNRDDEPIAIEENAGAWLNHSRHRANVTLVKMRHQDQLRWFLFAKRNVPKGEELTWDYNDHRKGIPNWMNQ